MNPLFYHPAYLQSTELPEQESKHCSKVLRLKHGDNITLIDGKGNRSEAVLTDPHPKRTTYQLLHTSTETKRKAHIHVAVAPTKNIDRMEFLVEKCVEIGIEEFTFIKCFHSERKDIKLERLEKIAVSAMKQSHKSFVPKLSGQIPFRQFIDQVDADFKWIANQSRGEGVQLSVAAEPNKRYCILIGPEGDFSEEELDLARDKGFSPMGLGPFRMRTETAALMACHELNLINYYV